MKTILCCLLTLFACTCAIAAAPTSTERNHEYNGTFYPDGIYHIVTYAAPVALRISETGLKEAGLAAGNNVLTADEIRVFSNRDVSNATPLARIFLHTKHQGAYWFATGGEGAASDFLIPEGAMVVVYTRASKQPLTWTNAFK